MCQAYEGERRMIVAAEDRAAREGYRDAKAGKPNSNPYRGPWQGYEEKAYDHGYACLAAGIKPYAVERDGEI